MTHQSFLCCGDAAFWNRSRFMKTEHNKLFDSQNSFETRLQELALSWDRYSRDQAKVEADLQDTLLLGLCDVTVHHISVQELSVRGVEWEKTLPTEVLEHVQRSSRKLTSDQMFSDFIHVDIERGTIAHAGKLTASYPLCRLLSLIENAQSAYFSEILQVCFGESNYVAQKHAPKIYNLLNRAKRLLGREAIFCRSEVMHVHGRVEKLQILRPPSLVDYLLRSKEWHRIRMQWIVMMSNRTSPLQRQADRILQHIPTDRAVSRATLQRLTGFSKATVARMIRAALDRGQVDRLQRGATPMYKRRAEEPTSEVDSENPTM